MHSVVERKLKKVGDLFLPSQLAFLLAGARKQNSPYKVKEVATSDVLDWKLYSATIGFLWCRESDEGNQ